MVRDRTGRFRERPYFEAGELDRECESLVQRLLKKRRGTISYPISTDDLWVLLEEEASSVDAYADLSSDGPDVEGVTEFLARLRPRVLIADRLSRDPRYENRLRTTISHEFGHVKFHNCLFHLDVDTLQMFTTEQSGAADCARCKRETMVSAADTDWMEWQAGYVSGAILMPVSPVRAAAQELGLDRERGPVAHDDARAVRLVARVQQQFAVSEEAARVRLMKLNHLASSRAARVFSLP